jgi:hypothetical protein
MIHDRWDDMLTWEQMELIAYNQIREIEEMQIIEIMAAGKIIKEIT